MQEHWLRRFAATAVARRLPLREIYIQFAPEFTLLDGLLTDIYPWDRMEHIARDIQRRGISLSWTDPTMSREYYEEVWEPTCGF